MGGDSWVRPVFFSPNGLFPNEEACVTQALDPERWFQAEERTAELIAHIQPNHTSVEHRNAVTNYVQYLIKKCFPCDVFAFGSVPFKTYLTDGDIDLTAFCMIQELNDNWASVVCNILEQEAMSEDAEFHVKDVLYIDAEVKIIKCIIDNLVVDISFNELGGLSTLCFLDEVDRLIDQNHLYKRSIILIKAWCYYEGRILGASHALISTYALETLVLYVFIVFNNSFAGPLEVLYRFLELFSKFDWDSFCVSLWGPMPCSSLPDMTAEPPRKDDEELFVSKMLRDTCSLVNDFLPGGQENQGRPFVCKYFNIIDPLRTNNNLGRSISKGNRFRICTAFNFGAQQLARLLVCPHENIMAEVDRFFKGTWSRHGYRPDARTLDLCGLQSINLNQIDGCGSIKKYSGSKKEEDFPIRETGVDMGPSFDTSNYVASQCGNNSLKHPPTSGSIYAPSHSKGKKSYASIVSSIVSDNNFQVSQNISTGANTLVAKCRISRPANEVQAEYLFARTYSSSETDTSKELPSLGKHDTEPKTGNRQMSSFDDRIHSDPAVLDNQTARFSTEDPPSSGQSSSRWSIDSAVDSNKFSNNYYDDFGSDAMAQGYFIFESKHMLWEDMTGSIDSDLQAVDSNQDNCNGRDNGLQPNQYVYGTGESPFSLYGTGPPVPFLSMLPVYNLPADEFNNFQNSVFDCSLDSTNNRDQLKVLYSSSSMVDCVSTDPSDNQMSDILNSDSDSHWQNLQYLWFCQDARHYPSPVVLPPTYSHRYSLSEDSGATPAEDMNLFNHLTHCSPHLIPISLLQPSFSPQAGLHQQCSYKIPRYYRATGPKLHHSPISSVGCQYPNARNHRGNYGYGTMGYHVYDEGSWNIRSKSQYTGHYTAPGEHLEFGPLAPEFFSGVDEASYLGEVSRSGVIVHKI